MKNQDKPINPIVNQHGYPMKAFQQDSCAGLTKLEYFSGLAIQSILLKSTKTYVDFEESKRISAQAIGAANELLKQLEDNK